MTNITMHEMLEAGVHFGHQTRNWNPKMGPYIFGARHKIHIINLEYTLPLYREALNFIHQVISNRGKVLFVGTKRPAQESIREEALRCGMFYVDRRWLGGMLTNYKTIGKSIKKLKELEKNLNDGSLELLTKKEGLMMRREFNKLEANLSGIKSMGGLPDALFVVDIGHEKTAVAEAKRLGIPVIGIVDTNNNPENVDYVVPGNDDSERAVRLYCRGVADTILAARHAFDEQLRMQAAAGVADKAAEAPLVEKRKVVIKKASKPKVPAASADVTKDKPASE